MALINKERLRIHNQIFENEPQEYGIDHEEPWDFYNRSAPVLEVRTQPHFGFEVLNPAKRLPIAYLDPLPARSAVVGVCTDGLPLLLDLTNPTPGSILILGEEPSGRAKIMNSLMTSICLINRVDQVHIEMISPQPGGYSQLFEFENCKHITSIYDRKSAEIIVHATALAEQRKSGRQLGPVLVIGIEDLHELIKNNEFEVLNHLRWLLHHGPTNGVWPVVSMDPFAIRDQDIDIITTFRTQIFAHDQQQQLPACNQSIDQHALESEYYTSLGGKRVNFWVPVWESS